MLDEELGFGAVFSKHSHPLVCLPAVHAHSFGGILTEQTALLRKPEPLEGLLRPDREGTLAEQPE
jgi:hypothetical protein